jgi:FkbM family methyltransferase
MAWSALGAKVIAVEPQPVCVEYLRRRFKADPNVTILDQAIGDIPGKAVMNVNSANPTISTLSGEAWREQLSRDARYPIHWDAQIEVRVTTLDRLVATFGMPAFSKIDVENSEYQALLGLSEPLRQMSFEYYPPAMANTYLCLSRLEALGKYEYNWSFGESLRLQSPHWVDAERLKKSHPSGLYHPLPVWGHLCEIAGMKSGFAQSAAWIAEIL